MYIAPRNSAVAGEKGFERADPEYAEQDQELADKAAGAGQPDRGQHECIMNTKA